MTGSRRVLVAGLALIGLVAGYWLYAAWPAWFGSEIRLAVFVRTLEGAEQYEGLEYPAARVAIDVPYGRGAESSVPHVTVKQLDAVWPADPDTARTARLLRGRIVYLQLEQLAEAPGRPRGEYGPVSISTSPVPGAMNLRAKILTADSLARLNLEIGWSRFLVGRGRHAPPGEAVAVLHVLPSGRHALVGLESGH
jgi:hypothetical protein